MRRKATYSAKDRRRLLDEVFGANLAKARGLTETYQKKVDAEKAGLSAEVAELRQQFAQANQVCSETVRRLQEEYEREVSLLLSAYPPSLVNHAEFALSLPLLDGGTSLLPVLPAGDSKKKKKRGRRSRAISIEAPNGSAAEPAEKTGKRRNKGRKGRRRKTRKPHLAGGRRASEIYPEILQAANEAGATFTAADVKKILSGRGVPYQDSWVSLVLSKMVTGLTKKLTPREKGRSINVFTKTGQLRLLRSPAAAPSEKKIRSSRRVSKRGDQVRLTLKAFGQQKGQQLSVQQIREYWSKAGLRAKIVNSNRPFSVLSGLVSQGKLRRVGKGLYEAVSSS